MENVKLPAALNCVEIALTLFDRLVIDSGREVPRVAHHAGVGITERLEGDVGNGRRFPFGLPRSDNANYLWIQIFASALNETGRAGFVMANSASDAAHSEQRIRQLLIEAGLVDVVVAISSNFFYTVTLPVTLWFLDKGKAGTDRENTVLLYTSTVRGPLNLPIEV